MFVLIVLAACAVILAAWVVAPAEVEELVERVDGAVWRRLHYRLLRDERTAMRRRLNVRQIEAYVAVSAEDVTRAAWVRFFEDTYGRKWVARDASDEEAA